MTPFKFFKGQLSQYFREINSDYYATFSIGREQPPFNLSRRHWNLLPQDLRGATGQGMECYIRGWEDARNYVHVNPYLDRRRAELWNRGQWRFINRRQ